MGADRNVTVETHNNGVPNGDGGSTEGQPQMPPQEEPPKMEEIVTSEVLESIIKGYKPGMKMVSFQAEPGSKIGDNYMSIMYALEILLEDGKTKEQETLCVMLKTIPRNVFRAEMINDMSAFRKESVVYEQIIPTLLELQNEKQIPKSRAFAGWPICYATHLDGRTDYLALENLKVAGYKMGNRVTGVDFNHCALVLRNLARFHAISFAKFGGDREKIVENYPILETGMFNPEAKMADMQKQFLTQSFKSLAENLRQNGEDIAAGRMEKLAESNFTVILDDLVTKNVEYAVVSHGDCWVNNMLFKYDKDDEKLGNPSKVKFLDFQLTQATSRLIDVYYFLMTSVKLDVLSNREEDLLMTYYTEFTNFAQLLGIDTKERGMTWEKLMKEADKCRLYGVFLGLLLAPMLAADAADIPDMETMSKEDFENTDEAIKKFYKDISKGSAVTKAKEIVMNHLPKCEGGKEFL